MGMAEAEHSGVPHWAAHRMSSLLCFLKIRLFFYQYFTSASRETLEVNCLPANGWRWRWDSDFQNKHGEWGLANKSLHTHSHPRASMCCDLDPPQEGCFDWPSEICDGLQNTLDVKGESCQEHRGMFYL